MHFAQPCGEPVSSVPPPQCVAGPDPRRVRFLSLQHFLLVEAFSLDSDSATQTVQQPSRTGLYEVSCCGSVGPCHAKSAQSYPRFFSFMVTQLYCGRSLAGLRHSFDAQYHGVKFIARELKTSSKGTAVKRRTFSLLVAVAQHSSSLKQNDSIRIMYKMTLFERFLLIS